MKKKVERLVKEIRKNSRLTSRELGKRLRTSQQSISYLIHSLEKNTIIKKYTTIFDGSRFGLIKFIVFFRSKDRDNSELIKYLKEHEDIVKIEKLSIGWDFKVIFSNKNISHFNKSLKELLNEFKKIDRLVILPVIVKYDFIEEKNILFGDREKIEMNDKELEICKILLEDGRKSFVDISKKVKLDPKTIVRIKKKLETDEVIKGYSVVVDHSKLDIRRFILLLRLNDYSLEADKRLINYCKNKKEIVSLFKTFGSYDLVLEIELRNKTLVEFLKDFRDNEMVKDYSSSISDGVIKEDYLPESVFLNS
jgi:DNA-binding Lrp family transcriptional regulator